ncbi:hypothetical protein Tco_1565438 [Tanacetum coccineum]
MISLKAQGIKALIPSALVLKGPRSKGLMAAILLFSTPSQASSSASTSQMTIPDIGSSSQASSSASTSQITLPDIGSTSEASSSASTSQITLPDIGSTSEASSSASTAPRLTKNQRSAIKLAVIMSIFVASGVLMSEVPK